MSFKSRIFAISGRQQNQPSGDEVSVYTEWKQQRGHSKPFQPNSDHCPTDQVHVKKYIYVYRQLMAMIMASDNNSFSFVVLHRKC